MFNLYTNTDTMNKLKTYLAVLMISMGALSAAAQSVQTSTTTKQVQHTKKDGTADKRYKTSTDTKVSATPTKKDGTPDMRYKTNKTTTTTKKAAKPKQ